MDTPHPGNVPLLVLFTGVSILLFFVFAPFLSILSLAAVFAILLHRPYEELTKILNNSKSLAASLTVGIVLLFFIVPLFFLGTQIFQEAQSIYVGIQGNGVHYTQNIQMTLEKPIRQLLPGVTFDLNTYVGNALTFISNNLASLIYKTFSVLFGTFLMLLALFFFLRDGPDMLASCRRVSPFGKDVTNEILNKLYQTTRLVVQGTLLIVLIRWMGIWISFYLFGIPNAILWSSIGGIIGAIPGLGTAFAFIPAVVYLYLAGNTLSAVGLALFGIAVIILADNILTSYFFGKGLEISSIFVLFSILGGVIFFGPVGFILGPLVLSIFLSVIHTYDLVGRKGVAST